MARTTSTMSDSGVVKLYSPTIGREVERQVVFADAIGKSKSDAIYDHGDFNKGDNQTYYLRRIGDDDMVTDHETLRGNERKTNWSTDSINIRGLATAVSTEYEMTPQRFPFDLTAEMAAENTEVLVRRFDVIMLITCAATRPPTR